MGKKIILRPVAALLALLMALTLAPAGTAAETLVVAGFCSACKKLNTYNETVVKAATCHESGIIKGVCSSCMASNLREIGMDPSNHDATYTDNGDGTHSGICNYHTPAVTISKMSHIYNTNGVCEMCGAFNYSKVVMDLPETRIVPVALNNAGAKLTAGDIKLTLGSANITSDYNLTYIWLYQGSQDSQSGQGSQVSTTSECVLPASVYGQEGVHYYTLIVSAQPKGTLSRQPVTKTCAITVQVKELITASAVITTQDTTLRLGQMDSWSADSISSQIYEAVQSFCPRSVYPTHVTFKDVRGSGVGKLSVTSTSTSYTFNGISGSSLDDVLFTPSGTPGDFTVGFIAYDSQNKAYDGVLTITVQQDVGTMDVVYTTARNAAVTFSSKEFEDYWEKVCPRGVLDYISFDEIPRSVEGSLFAGYTSASLNGDRVRTSDAFYVEPGRAQYGIDNVAFVPGVTQDNYITLNFTAYGTRSTGRASSREGTMYIFLSRDSRSADVSVTAPAAGAALDPAAFQKAYQTATGGTGSNFYIQLLDVPASGGLYVGHTALKQGVRLTEANVEGRPFAYSDTRGETISGLTYIPGTAATESIRYVASSAQGKPLYAGQITFTASGVNPPASTTGNVVPYTSTAAGVSFRSADFENLPGVGAAKLTAVSFTPPSPVFGALYYGRTAVSQGTLITSENSWFSVSSTAIAGANVMDNVTFVPAAGFTGTINIPFNSSNTKGERAAGSVQITVTTGGTTPTTPVNPSNPGTTLPVKVFNDVPQTEWYYKYVTELTTSGVLNGYEDGTFRPKGTVSLGEALKMIMISAGYPEQAPTDSHWASGYLARAKADNLLPANTIEKLDRAVNRYTIAEIACRALKLAPAAVTVSPFGDMAATVSSAPYVMALYNIQVITGDTSKTTGQLVYNGTYAIERSQFAAIIWRVQNYVRTGNVNGIVTPAFEDNGLLGI